ncbi:MAG: hypothetical protein WAM11_00290 [Cyanobium sp.]
MIPPLTPFPTAAPFRIDQVTAAPVLMLALFCAQLLVAALMSWAARRERPRLWNGLGLLLLVLVALFFTLGSWGNSDTTKLSHYLTFDLSRLRGEPFWAVMAPLIVRLPYRMSMVQGLVVAGYAAAPLLLARLWQARAWGGWWSLLIVCSPLLRNFLQNGVSRQALMTLLLLPLLLWAARLARIRRWPLALATGLAATVHTSFPLTLVLALVPRLLAVRSVLRLHWRVLLPAVAALGLLVLLAAPQALEKLRVYSTQESYFPTYALRPEVIRLQLAMALGVVLACWRRRLGWRQLLACDRSRCLAVFALFFCLLQLSLHWNLLAPITSRLVDPVGLYLLILWLGWLQRQRCFWAAAPALVVTVHYWLVLRLLGSFTLDCGSNDEFLCIPDRWPWQVRY